MAMCNGCADAELKRRLGDKYLKLGMTVYELDAEPCPGQGESTQHEGRSIQFHAWFMSNKHCCRRLDR